MIRVTRLTNSQRRELRLRRAAIRVMMERYPDPYTIGWEPQDAVGLKNLCDDLVAINARLANANGDVYTREVNWRWSRLTDRLYFATRRLREKRAANERAKLAAARFAWWSERNQNLPKFAVALERVDIEFSGKVPEGCPF